MIAGREGEGGRTKANEVCIAFNLSLSPALLLLPSFFISFRLRVSECECVRAKECEKEKKGGNDDE